MVDLVGGSVHHGDHRLVGFNDIADRIIERGGDKCVDPVRAKRGGVKVCVVCGVKDAGVGRKSIAGAAFSACIDRFVGIGGVLLAGWFQRDVQERLSGLASDEEKQRKTQCEAEQCGKYAFHRKPPCTPALRRAREHSPPRR